MLVGDFILPVITSSSPWVVDGLGAAAIATAIAGGDREAMLNAVGGSVTRSSRCATACGACLPGVFPDRRPRCRCQAGKPVIDLSEFPEPALTLHRCTVLLLAPSCSLNRERRDSMLRPSTTAEKAIAA